MSKHLFAEHCEKLSAPMDGLDREDLLHILEAVLRTMLYQRVVLDRLTDRKFSQLEAELVNFNPYACQELYNSSEIAQILESMKRRGKSLNTVFPAPAYVTPPPGPDPATASASFEEVPELDHDVTEEDFEEFDPDLETEE